MNPDFNEAIELAQKSTVKYFNHFRGLSNKSFHQKGLLEKQHPEILQVPQKTFALAHISKILLNLKLLSTQLKLALCIIGHTWNFVKTSEFISRDQFINGKFDSNTEQCIVGPANISASSLSPAMNGLVERGVIYRINIAHKSGPKTLYSPNPAIGYEMPYETDPRKRNWKYSNYPEDAQKFSDLIQSPAVEMDLKDVDCKYSLFKNLLTSLRHMELLPLLLMEFDNDYSTFLDLRNEWKKKITEKFESGDKLWMGLLSDAIVEVNQKERAWLEMDWVQDHITYLKEIRAQLDSPLNPSVSQADALMQAQMLSLRWGDTVLALSIDAWIRFEFLVQKFGTEFPDWKPFVEKYELMNKEREKVSWIKDSTEIYLKNQGLLKTDEKTKPKVTAIPLPKKSNAA